MTPVAVMLLGVGLSMIFKLREGVNGGTVGTVDRGGLVRAARSVWCDRGGCPRASIPNRGSYYLINSQMAHVTTIVIGIRNYGQVNEMSTYIKARFGHPL